MLVDESQILKIGIFMGTLKEKEIQYGFDHSKYINIEKSGRGIRV
ncbi:TPA: hypothetical protein ACGO4F_000681 [Streptococcus suis]